MKKSFISLITAMGLMESFVPKLDVKYTEDNNGIRPSDYSGHLQTVVPKGCNEYFFDSNGQYSIDGMRYDQLVFKCIALNDKSAIKKFNKWKESVSPLAD